MDLLRQHILANDVLQDELAGIEDREKFDARLIGVAQHIGIEKTDELIRVSHDPLGIASRMLEPVPGLPWPSRSWLPIRMVPSLGGRVCVDWAHFAGATLSEPFFEESVRRATSRPFNRMFPYRMELGDFLRPGGDCVVPDGFIFHMSRCGSTLVAQMLACLQGSEVISETPALDTAVQLPDLLPSLTPPQHLDCLKAMVSALGRRRKRGPLFFKLDSWHTLALPLFRRAFPTVPWLFLYRNPVEVLVSQERRRGLQTVPGAILALDRLVPSAGADFGARVLREICVAALDNHEGGLFVDYAELPEAVHRRILPHFRIAADAGTREAMQEVTAADVKMPHMPFSSDTDRKQREATPEIRDLADKHLACVYQSLQALGKAAG